MKSTTIMGMALAGAIMAAAPAEAAIFVNFIFTGDTIGTTTGTVRGLLGFDAAGTGVKATTVRILSSTNEDLGGEFDFDTNGDDINAFTVSEAGIVSEAALNIQEFQFPIFAGLRLNDESINGYSKFNALDRSLVAIANNGGFSGVTFTPFATTAAVPEPAGWAMMIAGFGLVGGTIRRRKVSPRIGCA